MDTKLLKQKILDLAIRGKLVPQDPNDEPASVLLERIRAEKEQLVQQGKIKKPKTTSASDTQHYENIPFDIPESWVWVRLGDVALSINNGANIKQMKGAGGIPITRIETISNDYFNRDRMGYADIEDMSPFEKYRLNTGDILISHINSLPYIGRAVMYQALSDETIIHGMNLLRLVPVENVVSNYIVYAFRTSNFRSQICQHAHQAVNQASINIIELSTLLLPIPPYAEQKRIVAELERWFALIDDLEANKQDLQAAIKQVRAKVLDLAIHGKLVPQDSNDEPSVELLKRINPHYIPCDTSHYENLPQGWCVCRLLDICRIDTGKWDANHAVENGQYRFYTCASQFLYCNTKRFSGECIVIPGNGDIGAVYYYSGDFDAYQRTYVLSNIQIYPKYLYYHLLHNWRHINLDRKFGSTIKFIRIANFQNYEVILPPLEEQIRLVKIIEHIICFTNTIGAEL